MCYSVFNRAKHGRTLHFRLSFHMKNIPNHQAWTYIIIGIIIGFAAFIIAAVSMMQQAGPTMYTTQPISYTHMNDALIGEESVAPSQTSGNYPKIGLPYIESGYRIQFTHCTGTPGSLVVKSGKYFLLDNRDAKPHTFAFAGQSHSIGGYGAAVAAIYKLGTFQITCDGGGTSKITVEK